jgi:hypothetical protein
MCVQMGRAGRRPCPTLEDTPVIFHKILIFKVIFTRVYTKMYSYIERIYADDPNIKYVVGSLCEIRNANRHESEPYFP